MNETQIFGAAVRDTMEKDAVNLGQMGKSLVNYATNRALPAVKSLAGKAVETAKPVVSRATSAAKPYVDDAAAKARSVMQSQPVKAVTDRAGKAVHNVASGVGTVGQLATDATRAGLNMADDAARYALNGPGRAAPAGAKIGDKIVRGVQTEAGRAFGTSPVGDKLNPLNLAAGAGTIYGAGKATGLIGGGGEATPENLIAQQSRAGDMQRQMQTTTGNNSSQGLMGMWNSLPIEARYAIGAGVPLALAGAFMGGRGNTGAGLGLGALGLGAAGLGAAGAGMFGDGPRRLVGQGANALYGMVGGSSDPMSQMRTLSNLSPEFGTTALMGRDPNLSSTQARGMYDFMTQNQDAIERLMPQLQNSSITSGSPVVKSGAALRLMLEEKTARCWQGYEPVPGKAPYTNGSCRPAGSKSKDKKKNEKKAGVSGQGKTTMSATPSSRGNQKLIDDKQRETNSPVPTDATNNKQEAGLTAEEKKAFVGALARGVGKAVGAGARGLMGAGQTAARGALGAADNMDWSGIAKQMPPAKQPSTLAPKLMPTPKPSPMSSPFQAGQTIGKGVGDVARGVYNIGQAGFNIAKGVAPLAQGVVGGAGAVARGAGTGLNMAGKALTMASKSPVTAIPTAAAGIYGASQMGGMMPKGMPQFRSPITWGDDNGVSPLPSGRINQPL